MMVIMKVRSHYSISVLFIMQHRLPWQMIGSYDFLLMFRCNHGSVSLGFQDIDDVFKLQGRFIRFYEW